LAAITGLAFTPAAAQTAHLSAALTILPASGLTNPYAAAVDASGKVYIADTGNSRIVIETPQIYGGYTQSTLATATPLNGPQSVAVDASGSVYIADTQNHRVLKETPSINPVTGISTYAESTVANLAADGLELPTAVAVDKYLNVYIASFGNDAALKMSLNSSGFYGAQILSLNQLQSVYGIAVDANLNVYLADYNAGIVFELPWTGSAYGSLTGFQIQLNHPTALAVDANQTVYVADSGNNRIIEDIHTSGASFNGYSYLTGLSNPLGVAVDPKGNLYFANTGLDEIVKVSKAGANFGPLGVSNTPIYAELYFTFDTGGSGVTPVVLTQGSAILDFTDSDAGTCTTNGASHVYSAGDSCSVIVSFKPLFAGTRYGAALLQNSSNASIATGPLQGTGLAPLITFPAPNLSQVALSGVYNAPAGLAVDSSGNIYLADTGDGQIEEILAKGGYATVNDLGNGYFAPAGVAVDGSGNVFVADTSHGLIKEILAVNGSIPATSPSINTLASITAPYDLAVDGGGNIFVVSSGGLSEILAVNGVIPASPTILPIGSGFNAPYGVALDGSGDVFVADTFNHAVKEVVAVNGSIPASPAIIPLGSNFNQPWSLALDPSGNIYVADNGNSAVYEITAASNYVTVNTLGSGFTGPAGVAVDISGNVYVADDIGQTFTGGNIYRLGFANAPTLNFPNTVVNFASSPQTVIVANIGNQPLIFSSFQYPGDFPEYPGISSDCSTSAQLPSGDSCTLTIDFAPLQATSQIAQVMLADNSFTSSQVVAVNGTGVSSFSQTITFPAITGSQDAKTSFNLSATASSGLTVAFASASPTICTVSGTTATLLIPGACVIHATQAGNAEYSAAPMVAVAFAVSKATQTITFPTVTGTHNALTSLNLAATASSGLAVVFTSATTSVCTISATTATLLQQGTCIVKANQAGSTLYTYAPTVQQSIVVHLVPQTISFPVPAGEQYALTPVQLTATASSGLPITYASITPDFCTVSGSIATPLKQGSCFVHASQAGSNVYSVSPLVTQFFGIHLALQTITFPAITATQYVLGSTPLSATASSGLTVAFASATPAVCTVSGTTATLKTTGDCVIHATQAGNKTVYAIAQLVSQSIIVHAIPQTITFPAITGTHNVNTTVPLSATASSGGAVSFATASPTICTVSATTATLLAAGPCVIHATQAGTAIYAAAPMVAVAFAVAKGSQTISFPAIPTSPQPTATQSLALSATATSSLVVSFASTTPTVCSVSGTAASLLIAGTCTLQATQAGNANWVAAPLVQQSFLVFLAPQTINPFQTVTSYAVGNVLYMDGALSATSGLPVSLSSTTNSICTVSGTVVTFVAPGTCVLNANQAGNATYAAAPMLPGTITVTAN
jgi:DNA-binding beta-propeller fold protein YncE